MSSGSRNGGGGGGGGDGAHAKKRRHPAADVPASFGASAAASSSSGGGAMAVGSSSGAPRTLHVLEFAEARAREIASLTNVLSGGGGSSGAGAAAGSATGAAQISGGGRRVFQSLPRHMRRRAMSHNIKRLPLRLQGAAKREMDKIARSGPAANGGEAATGTATGGASKALSRRARRRPRNILALHAHRMGVHQWLESHIWHAKRMKMDNRWGYKLALHPTDRSLRACYNAAVGLATAYDISFMQVLAVWANDQHAVAKLLAAFVTPADVSGLLAADVLAGRVETQLRFHLPGAAPYGFVAHVKCQWQAPAGAISSVSINSSAAAPRQLWMWLHPATNALIQSLLESAAATAPASSGARVEPLLGELCRIELRGHRCQAVMRMAIRAVEASAKSAAATGAAAAASKTSESKDDTEMSDAAASPATAAAAPAAIPNIADLLATYASPALFPAHRIYALQAQHPEQLHPSPSQPFDLMDGKREKQRGGILPASKRNSTFSKATDASMQTQLSKAHHALLYGESHTDGVASASPLFDSAFRRAHTRETLWGAKKQRYARIARKDTERKRKMHERRAEESASAIAAAAAAAASDEEAGAVSDTTSMRRKKPTAPISSKGKLNAALSKPPIHSIHSKDDLDVGTSSTPLPSASPPIAPLTKQPYLMLIQQPGTGLQGSAAAPSLQVNSSTHSLGSGWDIVCSSGWGILLWKALIYAGARSIGSHNRARFQHELRSFDALSPQDAPDSHAGQAALLFRQRVNRWHNDRVPTNKKPNFALHHIAHPFAQPFFELLELGSQADVEAQYDDCIVKPTPASRRYEHAASADAAASDADDEEAQESQRKKAKTTSATTVAAGEHKEKEEDAAMEDIDTPAATAAAAVAAPSVSSRKAKRQTKRLPLPHTEPPFELLPIPPAFASKHLPFYVWRTWHNEWQQARVASPTLTLAAFLLSPAAPPLSNVLLSVSLRCDSGGRPEDDALICAPQADEWQRFRTATPAPSRCDDVTLSHNERNAKALPWDVLQERNNKSAHPHPKRATIGHVTHGWFSYQQGCGVGLGFVAAQQFVQLMLQQQDDPNVDHQPVWVWCRNQNSLAYRAARIELLAQ